MNLIIHDFTNNNSKKIKKEYLCKNHDGNDISPRITWKNIDNVKSYALIFEDINVPSMPDGTYIHMYIPYISTDISEIKSLNHISNKLSNICDINLSNLHEKIKSMKIFYGKNSTDCIGYKGPCNPDTTVHKYIFRLYALDGILDIDTTTIKINSSGNFLDILKKKNINILSEESVAYEYVK